MKISDCLDKGTLHIRFLTSPVKLDPEGFFAAEAMLEYRSGFAGVRGFVVWGVGVKRPPHSKDLMMHPDKVSEFLENVVPA